MQDSRYYLAALVLAAVTAKAASYDPALFSGMHWRSIGPLRGGRTTSAAGAPGQPGVFYAGAANGGVWKTDDYGRTWQPIFDDQSIGSIGAIAVTPSDPAVLYVGTGEGLDRPDLSLGNGLYKSTDAGKTWTHLGLADGQRIPRIAVDPHNPDRLFVAVLGHPFGPHPDRGIYRSTDGGRTFVKVLYRDQNTGGNDVAINPSDSNVVYASLRQARLEPGDSARPGGIFKSTDGGTTWRPLTRGLPSGADGVTAVTQANLAIAPGDARRVYASIAAPGATSIYRSDDAGENWELITTDPRPAARVAGSGLPVLAVDPTNPGIVYSASVVAWKSTDGGKRWTALRGSPGSDNYLGLWIDPGQPKIILLASDHGAVLTVNGGRTWSSWYNQPTAQMDHVNADDAFPYRVCGGNPSSGSACVSSRGNDGQITVHQWHAAGAMGSAVPDPLEPDLVFGGQVTRFDRRTGQVTHVAPVHPAASPIATTGPLVFSAADPHLLFFGENTVWKTADGGRNWRRIGPDTGTPICAIAPSPLDVNRIWAGTAGGAIYTTPDGGLHWKKVTPPHLHPRERVSAIDAGHFDALTAYAAIDARRLDDLRPRILRTHDGGKTWTEIVHGIPSDAPVNSVREDLKRKGLLFAGTEREVYVSFDDGGSWQSMRLNMPATSIRDIAIKDNDLVAATGGRGFWILDNITPLRQLSLEVTTAEAWLFAPAPAYRVRWNMNTDTPLPPDEPAGPNPPDGAILDYYLSSPALGRMTLEILDHGALVRRYSTTDVTEPGDTRLLSIPEYWVRPPQPLSNQPGLHRFVWDLRYAPLPGSDGDYPIQAVLHDTPRSVTSIWVMPGRFTVRLSVNGRTYERTLTVRLDPRVKTPLAGIRRQFTLAKQLNDGAAQAAQTRQQLDALRRRVWQVFGQARGTAAAEAVISFDRKAAILEGGFLGTMGPGASAPDGRPALSTIIDDLAEIVRALSESDAPPTSQIVGAALKQHATLSKLMARWNVLKGAGLALLNLELERVRIPTVVP